MSPSLKIGVIPVTPFQQNCSLLWEETTKRGVVIDPGGDVARIRAAIAQTGIIVERILLTHGHMDHAGGAALLKETLNVPVEGPHRDDMFWLDQMVESGARYGVADVRSITPDRFLNDGDVVTLGSERLSVMHCPGHTPGHVVFFHAPSRLAIVGDVLFRGSIGRSDFPRGDHAQLIRSITEKLWPLGDDVNFLPGHGEPSTFGWERKTNPFVSDLALQNPDG